MTTRRVRLTAREPENRPTQSDLQEVIGKIGLARFVGRINSGVIAPEVGYRAVETFMSNERKRPFLSKFGQLVFGNSDSYER